MSSQSFKSKFQSGQMLEVINQGSVVPRFSLRADSFVFEKMTYFKGKRSCSSRASRPKKRQKRFSGMTYDNSEEFVGQSASAKKLHSAAPEKFTTSETHGYRLVEFFSVFTALSQVLVCKNSKSNVSFKEDGHRGFGFKILVTCSNCASTTINSGPFIDNEAEINRRIVIVIRLLGVGREGLNLLRSLMDICGGLSSSAYSKIIQHIYTGLKIVFDLSCVNAAEEETKENAKKERSILNFKVSGDGTWKKRGFSSLYGVTTLIAYYSGKVVDLIVKSSYCSACTWWKSKKNTAEYEIGTQNTKTNALKIIKVRQEKWRRRVC